MSGTPFLRDPADEERDYCRALLSAEELARLKEDVAREGVLPIEQVRLLVRQNSVKETADARGCHAVDPELMVLIDTRTDYAVYIADDDVYTRGELLAHYPFADFATTPEAVFAQQEIGVFPARGALALASDSAQCEYVARDVGDPEDFATIEDLVGRTARSSRGLSGGRRAPARVVKTKIFLGKERWEVFTLMGRFVRGFRQFLAPALAGGGGLSSLLSGDPAAFPALMAAGAAAGGPGGSPSCSAPPAEPRGPAACGAPPTPGPDAGLDNEYIDSLFDDEPCPGAETDDVGPG